jgi:hypothetical protein
MTTISIPLTSLSVGLHDFGPAAIADGLTTSNLSVDRTVAGGLDSLTPASTLQVQIMQSNDGGATWTMIVGAGAAGGVFRWTDKNGVVHQATTFTCGDGFLPGTGRLVKATVTVAGPSSIAVQGTLTLL